MHAAAISFILHLDKHMSAMIQQHGTLTYAILWTIVFCETGLVLTPFLPGDSLLFAAGAFAGMGQLDLGLLFAVFMTSAVLGDAVNYAIGSKLGESGITILIAIESCVFVAHILPNTFHHCYHCGACIPFARCWPAYMVKLEATASFQVAAAAGVLLQCF